MNTVLVLGGGPHVWAEALDAYTDFNISHTIAINQSIADFPGYIDIAITLHPDKMAAWLSTRESRGYPAPANTVAHKRYNSIATVLAYKWPEMGYSGSSGLFAVKAALELLKAERVILAGVPMSNEAHYYKKPSALWTDGKNYVKAWQEVEPRLRGVVKSYSGYTRELLGAPKDWL